MLPNKLQKKIEERIENNAFRTLGVPNVLVDFSSNDYLGFSTSKKIFKKASEILKHQNLEHNGATGSRLLSGNRSLYTETESQLATFHNSESALIFNSGYDANLGFFSSVPQRGDIILYDELCHASIRDGIRMSNAKSYKFKHNDLLALAVRCEAERSLSLNESAEIYIVTESVFSMDGDTPDLKILTEICKNHNAHLIIDEAHAVGIFGENGAGLVQELGLENDVFARIVTFGKALGCHGAAILGSAGLKSYLINFARSFIYTTALPPHSVATILSAYKALSASSETRQTLKSNIAILQNEILKHSLQQYFISSSSAIHSCIITGNDNVKQISEAIEKAGFDVKAILSPTVAKGEERLRICLHSFNTKEQIKSLIAVFKQSL